MIEEDTPVEVLRLEDLVEANETDFDNIFVIEDINRNIGVSRG